MGGEMASGDQAAPAPAMAAAATAAAEPADTFEAVPVEESAPAAPPADMGAAQPGEAAPAPAPMTEVTAAASAPSIPAVPPAVPAAAAATVGTAWATVALKHLDSAQQALSSGDWGTFGQAMNTLRSALESAASGSAAPAAEPAPSPAVPAAAAAMGAAAAAGPEEGASSAWGGDTTDNGASEPGYQPYADSAAVGAAAAAAADPYAMPAEQAAQPALGPAPVPTGMADMGTEGIARLVVISTGAELSLPEQEEITVGREDPSSGIFPDVDLTPYGGEDGGVSRRHARLLHIGDDYFVEDLQSTNYTKLDGQRLPAHVRERLEDGARLDFGRVAVIFRRS
jgi:hypothetical protein